MESAVRQAATERVTRPTLVRLDFRDRALAEVVHALNDRHDFRLALQVAPDPPPGGISIFGDPDEPQRLARLRAEGCTHVRSPLRRPRRCRFGTQSTGFARPPLCDTKCRFRGGWDPARAPWSCWPTGPAAGRSLTPVRSAFRSRGTTWLTGTTSLPISPPGPPGRRVRPAGGGELTVPLAILAEPGLVLHPNGPVTIDEAVDDWGRALAMRAPKAPTPRPADRHAFGQESPASIEVNVQLAAPTLPVTIIRRLRGKVPVIVVSRGSDPLVIPLNGESALGKMYRSRDMNILVDEISLDPRAEVFVGVTRPADSAFQRSDNTAESSRPDFTSFNSERVMEHMELYDAAGRRLNHVIGGHTIGVAGNESFLVYPMIVVPGFEDGASIQLPGEPAAPPTPVPTELRYYGFVQTALEVPFDFRDIPMP